MHDKKEAYRRNGVREYVIWRVEDRALVRFVLHGALYELLPKAKDGILRSEVFPGLRLDAAHNLRSTITQGTLASGKRWHGRIIFSDTSARAG